MGEGARVPAIIDETGLQALLGALRARGYSLLGPSLRDGAIVYDEIADVADLPRGCGDEQDGGHYRVTQRGDDALFGYAVGPQSWKRFLHPPVLRLWRARREGDELRVEAEPEGSEKYAFIGARSCELHAIAIQDRVLIGGEHVDPHYRARRENIFVVAVNCGVAGGACFCVSMKTGPKATSGYDLALTELIGDDHRFLVEIGTEDGGELLGALAHRDASASEIAAAEAVVAQTAANMGRSMQPDVASLLARNLEHERWDEAASRCLSCTNCTMVCPTCFCTSVEDASDLFGAESSRSRRWDSCFTMDFSYIHGGSVRSSGKSRYRQWMTHKLSTWHDQFGTTGCVGCGRCIVWCPVGIDITEEARAIAESETKGGAT
ncbi:MULTISPECIES: sulfite reductase subunit A [Methylosinus]|uniref:Sulfite reductase subunit A n=1 Tax=Methylosinus trichosporium (strain ATCC 35070 / NCIMB 11131 / UNIQEM 75 / OB3b) TaxID=595536 RepID=A0A2D2D4R3_METT3|nr:MULTISPECIES: sulfite reductase subunit A [Methylosinus]ATQ69966.1 sulfite reductase subunit A [Methylosinus trichosporium OB3b]OBS51116.1 sulfite reductase subunit A [Methylosinus sp. 3S-1]